MDHFGIGAALKGVVDAYFAGARRTGRTTSLVDSVHPGDRIICVDDRERARLLQMLDERFAGARVVDVVVVRPSEPLSVFAAGYSTGRTLFEHSWLEILYQRVIAQCAHDVDSLQRQTSGCRNTSRREEATAAAATQAQAQAKNQATTGEDR